ncbi:type IV pilin protein [Pseudomonas neustonica]|uniref:type IV pilin protein n=1 Tax=Pseudomonas neustonica TaxID=2487346 RepID=UPI003F44A77E
MMASNRVLMRPTRLRGFTLIEVMIVVVIIGILVSIAYPAYQDYVRRTRQADAQAQIMAFGSALERYRGKHFSYDGATLSALAPELNANSDYNINFAIGGGDQSYTITATAQGSLMSGMPTLTLNSAGEASWN